MPRWPLAVLSLLAACGGERSWELAATDLDGVVVRLNNGEMTVLTERVDVATVDWSGGGVGRGVWPSVGIADGVMVVDAFCDGLCGGELDVVVPPGLPLLVEQVTGEVDLELSAPAHVSACLGAGELDIALPAGGYMLDLDAGAGEIDVEGVWDDPQADHAIKACVSAGELSVHALD